MRHPNLQEVFPIEATVTKLLNEFKELLRTLTLREK